MILWRRKSRWFQVGRRGFARLVGWGWLLLLVAGLAASPARAQDEGEPESTEPFFSVSSSQTYAPSEKPHVGLSFRQVDHLDFRIYRVKDPFAFFSKLREAHSLGSEKAELAREKTWLERFHEWKRDLRLAIRDFFRGQLKYETRVAFSRSRVQERKLKRLPLDVASYAQVPLLNRQQLVTAWRELVPKTRGTEYQDIPVDLTQKGLYLVEVTNGGLRAYTVLMVTDLALVSKSSAGQILLYVARRDSGAPVPEAAAVVLNNHQELSRGTTDSSGIFEAKFGEVRLDNAIMVVQNGDDVAATSVESFFFFDTSATEFVGYLYTDRPVYRPTHEVNFKGVMRARTAGQYTLNLAGPVTVQVNDPHQKTIYQQKLNLTPFGSFNGKLALNAFAPLGSYQIVAQIGDRQVFGSFEVEAYQKPEFEVAVTTDKARYLEGESIQAVISAKYYFGAPVANAQVKYSIYKARYYFPYWWVLWGMEEYEGDEGEEGSEPRWNYYGEEIRQATGRLDADGTLRVSVPTEVDEKHEDYRYRIEAHVTDASNHEIVGGRGVIATYSTVVVLLDMDRYGYAAGDHAGVAVRTLDYDSQPVSIGVSLYFESRENWDPNAPRRLLSQAKVTTDVHGVAHYDYPVANAPWIFVRASVFDSNGREAKFETSIWVYGARWGGSEIRYQRPEIYLDKRTYKPGETAHVLVVTNEPGTEVLITTEGQKVYTWSVRAAPEGSVKVDIPIEGRLEPNFYVGVTFVKNEQLFEATKDVPVPAGEKVLKVTVETDKPQYKPDEKVTYTIQTRDQNDRPVSAEVSLGVVDEAIYAIQPDSTPAPDKFFYARSYNRVYTQFSTTYWFSGYSGKNRIELTFLRAPTRLADFKNPGQLVQPKVRKYFPDTIYWSPVLVTDASGTARATFTFPDSLTTWRATVRAMTKDTLVGQVIQKVITRKNLILRLEIPRFLTQGDTVTVTGIVHNYLDQDKTAEVSLQATGVELAGAASSSVNVPKNGEAVVTWTVRAPKIGEADFVGKALTDQESDALELTAPVRPWGVQMDAGLSGSLADADSSLNQKIVLPTDINPDASSIRIDLAPSVAGALMSALDFLTSYPYGCVEQTMSSFLPNILVSKAVKELGLTPPAPSAELDKKIAAGLERLYRYQHDDGGWGWWETDETHPFMTAYVVAGLAEAEEAGYPVDEDRLERGRESLILQIRQNPRALGDIRAYLLYGLETSLEPGLKLPEAFEATRKKLSLANQERARARESGVNQPTDQPVIDPAWVENLVQDRDKLSPYGLALMALTLGRMKDPRAGDFVKLLEQSAQSQGPYVQWKSERQEMLDFSSDNSFEATAYALKAISGLDPKSPLLPRAAKWLMDSRADGYYWFSTEQTAMAIYGLMDYLKISGELQPNYTVSVQLNGQKIGERTITAKEVSNPEPIILTAGRDAVHPGSNELRIVKKGPGVLYWSANATYFGSEARPTKAGSTALNILREYFRLVPDRVANRIVYSEQPLSGPVQSGEIVVVRLTVSATSDEKYLEIEDPVPAGFEFVEQEGLYELKEKPPWWDFYYTEREFFDDHAALFSKTFDRGQGQFHYLLRAVEPGTFMANPARVLPMYEPRRQASTKSATVSVTPR